MLESADSGIAIGIVAVYFVPALVAFARRCKATAGIVILDLFLGWTFIGWVAALAWAACGQVEAAPVQPPGAPSNTA